jgi:hypothetical protein
MKKNKLKLKNIYTDFNSQLCPSSEESYRSSLATSISWQFVKNVERNIRATLWFHYNSDVYLEIKSSIFERKNKK